MTEKYHFECHVTLENNSRLERAVEFFSKKIQMKLIHIVGVNLNDTMTSSRFYGTYEDALVWCNNIYFILKENGFPPLRIKLETEDRFESDFNAYYESHIPIMVVDDFEQYKKLIELSELLGVHVSRNRMKRPVDGKMVQMLTLRTETRSDLREKASNVISHLKHAGYDVLDKIEYEAIIFDSNRAHDDKWINKKD